MHEHLLAREFREDVVVNNNNPVRDLFSLVILRTAAQGKYFVATINRVTNIVKQWF